ncbi:endonuclease/exonuclease/phosphatase family protein [Aminivibrio sp.]
MIFVLYNIRYGTGSGWDYHLPVPFSGCLRHTEDRFSRISDYVTNLNPDLVGLVEADSGSYRNKGVCQAEMMASRLGGESVFACKYDSGSFVSRSPLLKSQGNAVVSKLPILSAQEYHMSRGMKRTLLEVEFDTFSLFLAHLSLGYATRQIQIAEITERVLKSKKPVLLAGDGNTYRGESELKALLDATGLKNANEANTPTYPSRIPSLALDFILHRPKIAVKNFTVPKISLSDHLPLVVDFSVGKKRKGKAAR